MQTFGQRLKEARLEAGFTQEGLAKRCGLASQSTIGNMESGVREGSRHIGIIASALGVSALWLETGKGQRKVMHSVLAIQVADAFSTLSPERQRELAPIIAAAIGTSISDAQVEQRMPITQKHKQKET